MHFVVCAKQIPDPETPPSAFRIDESTNAVVPAPGIAPVPSTPRMVIPASVVDGLIRRSLPLCPGVSAGSSSVT